MLKHSTKVLVAGKFVSLLSPDLTHVTDELLARTLSHINRWSGNTTVPMTVAQHSVFVATLVHPKFRYAALMHDVTEIVIGDVSDPIKQLFPELQEIEALVWKKCCERWSIKEDIPEEIRLADEFARYREKYLLLDSGMGLDLDPVREKELKAHFAHRAGTVVCSAVDPTIAVLDPKQAATKFLEYLTLYKPRLYA